jgi:hypothetical protein
MITMKIIPTNNKVRELAIVCLPWQEWTETSVWFDDVGISACRSCVVADQTKHSTQIYTHNKHPTQNENTTIITTTI